MYWSKRILPWMLLTILVVCGCTAPEVSRPENGVAEPILQPEEIWDTEIESMPYIRPEGLPARETIEEYIFQQYQIYTDLDYTDLSCLIDTGESRNELVLIWLQALVQRRKLLLETGLCYVETQMYPYEFHWIDEEALEDERMTLWQERIEQQGETALHFVITGEEFHAYPPMLALNSQHTVFLKLIDGEWMITFHYYPGARRRSGYDGSVYLAPEEQMLEDLWFEFQSGEDHSSESVAVPAGAARYRDDLAVEYALRYTEEPNPDFYHVGDWMGNCSNFVSQCIWYAFGDGSYPDLHRMEHMTSEWFAGAGGGSSAWENVSRFWLYAAVGNNDLHGVVLESAAQLHAGDIIQLGAADGEEETFNHCFLVVDSDTLLLAQNSPPCYVYYSDLVLTEHRYFRPLYLRQE